MKKNILINTWAAIALIVTTTAACGSKKALITDNSTVQTAVRDTSLTDTGLVAVAVPAEVLSSSQNTVALPETRSLKFSTLVARAKASLAIGGKSNDVTMNIRIKDKEAIWVSVTALAGLEVARAMITPDSIRVINRLDNIYITRPFSFIHEFTNNKISFNTLQSILVGDMIAELVDPAAGTYVKVDQNRVEASMETMLYQVIVNDKAKVAQNNLSDAGAGQKLDVTYSDFQPLADQLFPYSVVMKSEAKSKSISLDLRMSKVEFDVPAEMPFRVPDRYVIKN